MLRHCWISSIWLPASRFLNEEIDMKQFSLKVLSHSFIISPFIWGRIELPLEAVEELPVAVAFVNNERFFLRSEIKSTLYYPTD